MPNTTSTRECPICLDKFRDPVVTPCGHLACNACIKRHARISNDPYEAACPTCRAPFPIVTPNMNIIPEKYHVFISAPLRRVFLEDAGDPNHEAIIEKLNAENAALKARVSTLKRDKDLLMDRCEAAQCALTRLTSEERAARLARDEARHETRLAKLNLEKLRVEHGRLIKCRDQGLCLVAKGKRTSRHAALDDSMRASSSDDSSESSCAPVKGARPIKPMPKRPKLRPTQARIVSPERIREPSSSLVASGSRTSFSSSESSSSSEPALRTSVQTGRRSGDTRTRRSLRSVDYMDSSSNEADNHGERRNMEGVPTARLPPLIQYDHDAPLPSPMLTRYRSRTRRDGGSPPS